MGANPARSDDANGGAQLRPTANLHDDAVAQSLPWLGWCLGCLFGLVAVAYANLSAAYETTDNDGFTAVIILAAVTAVSSALLSVAARAGRIPPGRAHLALSGLILLGVVLSLGHLAGTRDISTSTGLMLTMVGTGAGLVSARWVAGWLVAMWAGWLLVAIPIEAPHSEWTRWAMALLSASFLAVLVSTVRRRGIDALAAALARAEQEAVRDALTGLLNRRGLDLFAVPLLEGARRRGYAVHCLFVDVNGLKQVNDAGGHGAGDALLVAVAEALQSVTRSSDVVIRWAGDEFCVVGLGPGMRPDELEARLATMSVTVGAAGVEPWEDGTIEDLLAAADAAMYARRTGAAERALPLPAD
ncbi:MAG: GGDEF domain-containing protein [Candidatus Nanopelagicales bacterium]